MSCDETHQSLQCAFISLRGKKKVWLERLQFTIEWLQQKTEDKNLSKESERKIKMGTDKGWWLEGGFDCNQHIINFRITTRWHTGERSLVFLKISSSYFPNPLFPSRYSNHANFGPRSRDFQSSGKKWQFFMDKILKKICKLGNFPGDIHV